MNDVCRNIKVPFKRQAPLSGVKYALFLFKWPVF